jgi:hypothetical protein
LISLVSNIFINKAFDLERVSAQITNGDLERWWRFAASFSGPNHPFKQGGGQFVRTNQPGNVLCLTCTGDRQPGNDPEPRQLPAVTNQPILIPVFVAGASTQELALNALGNNVTTNLMINGNRRDPVRVDTAVHGIEFRSDNPFDEPPRNNPTYHTVGFWFKIPATEVASVTTIEFGGSSSTFTTSVRYQR